MTEKPGDLHQNNFGALRLILAGAVIISHSPEMIDGNPSREPLMALGLHVTFGGLAVSGFFIISGYLIAGSYIASQSLGLFLRSRILRIYPAFVVACLLCIFVVAPFADGTLGELSVRGWLAMFGKMAALIPPEIPNAFRSLPIPALDGSMWTIRYEFRCYLLVALLGVLGLLVHRRIVLAITAIAYGLTVATFLGGVPNISQGVLHKFVYGGFGDPVWVFQLGAIFLSGVCARLYRDRIRFDRRALVIAGFLLCVSFAFASPVPEISIGTLGTYLLLWAATRLRSDVLRSINNSYDFSYGVYLYAWPIASIIILVAQRGHLILHPAALAIVTAILSTMAGAISWYVVEQPALRLKLRRPLRAKMRLV